MQLQLYVSTLIAATLIFVFPTIASKVNMRREVDISDDAAVPGMHPIRFLAQQQNKTDDACSLLSGVKI